MITNKRLIEILRENSADRIGIVERKNSNYAGGGPEGNAFKNFDMVETLSNGKVTREMGMFVRMTDKLARLGTLMFGGEDAVGESVEDTLQDLANYSDLALVAWRDKHANEPEPTTSFQTKTGKTIAFVDAFPPIENHNDIPNTEDARSILSRFLNFGQDRERAA